MMAHSAMSVGGVCEVTTSNPTSISHQIRKTLHNLLNDEGAVA